MMLSFSVFLVYVFYFLAGSLFFWWSVSSCWLAFSVLFVFEMSFLLARRFCVRHLLASLVWYCFYVLGCFFFSICWLFVPIFVCVVYWVQVYFCLVRARVARSWWPGPGSRWPGPGGPVPVPGVPCRAPFFAVTRWPGPGPGPGPSPCRLSCPGLVLVARWPGPGPGPGSGLL